MPKISTVLKPGDRIGACKARWGIGRMDYIVPPGLYAVGLPGPDDPVLVTANYKMSYDLVRSRLDGRNIWLLVLETYGINVWCAAGKGTFGTGEVVRRVTSSSLAAVVNHRRLIMPILGAPGVAAHQVAKRCGFTVHYSVIRIDDIGEYLDSGMVATPAMRELTFGFYERMVLIPVEIMLVLKSLVPVALAVMVAVMAASGVTAGTLALCGYVGAVLSGIAFGPLLLPWLPGRSFAVKGWCVGLVWVTLFYRLAGGPLWSIPVTAAVFTALPVVSAFYTLNFTGCSTYTSRSGVRKEMKYGLPLMGGAVVLGIIMLVVGRFM